MKKYVLSLAVLMMAAATFTACSNDDESENHGTMPVAVSNGAYVVCSGNQSASIDGSLTYYDYEAKTDIPDAFRSANGISLGVTANDALRYGDKLYIVVDGENSLFVTDAKTLKTLKRISLVASDMLGEQGGASPRRITADAGNIYVSTFGGYVAAIDTASYQLVKKYQAGSYPEGIAVKDGYLYVANSDYGNGNASISKINLSTGADTPITGEDIRNPQTIAIAGNDIYYLDYGQYGPAPTYAQEHAGVYRISGNTITQVVPDATGMDAAGYNIYTFNAPYGGSGVSYSIYNITTGQLSKVSPVDIESPAAIGVDPYTGNVLIASYHTTTSEWGTYADYRSNGYVNVYDSTLSSKKGTFDCGVGPTRIIFNVGIDYINY